ncbi:MAG: response regulator transcription factor [Lachnospiraceae bacterium]|nr:response regulator transcription factor [Lachnospiraceae bacterium]
MAIRVFLVDDEELLTESMEIILTVKGQMDVVGIAKDGKEALELLSGTSADVALVDLNMKGMGGIELIPKLKELYPEMKILVLTTFYDNHYITEALSGGADGYLLKDSSGDMIIKAIHQLLAGQSVLAAKVLAALTRMMTGDVAALESRNNESRASENGYKLPKDLTPRELEICGLLTKGYSNTELAKELFLAEGTVKNYMMSIYDKFDIHDRTALVLFLKDIIA